MNKVSISIIGLLLSILFGLNSCSPSKNVEEYERPERAISLQKAVINYLVLKKFVNPEFSKQVLGEAVTYERFVRREDLLYFSANNDESLQATISSICSDTSLVEFGSIEKYDNEVVLDKITIDDTNKMLFRFPPENLIFDSTRVIKQQFDSFEYSLSIQELRDFLAAKKLFNGPALVVADTTPEGQLKVLANHAAPIALPGEPTLNDLVHQIVDTTESMEAQAQDLLDFVTQRITYKDHGKYEIFMKPHETLLSKETDCSGKVVLYSSFLTQLNIPHLLVYMPGHICVGVKGDFSEKNKMFFEHETGRYYIAETTALNFKIGKTRFIKPIEESSFQYLQRPGYQNKVYDLGKKDSLDFAVVEVEID